MHIFYAEELSHLDMAFMRNCKLVENLDANIDIDVFVCKQKLTLFQLIESCK